MPGFSALLVGKLWLNYLSLEPSVLSPIVGLGFVLCPCGNCIFRLRLLYYHNYTVVRFRPYYGILIRFRPWHIFSVELTISFTSKLRSVWFFTSSFTWRCLAYCACLFVCHGRLLSCMAYFNSHSTREIVKAPLMSGIEQSSCMRTCHLSKSGKISILVFNSLPLGREWLFHSFLAVSTCSSVGRDVGEAFCLRSNCALASYRGIITCKHPWHNSPRCVDGWMSVERELWNQCSDACARSISLSNQPPSLIPLKKQWNSVTG